MPSNKVRTRFAPSPTGYMHVGNLRTPGGGTDLACMMGRAETINRVKAAIAKLNG